ncbi:MAG TPA: DedA family protein [Candidatus Binataceae bacterium]|nr:DedA family protein [Candidatus Binataceae bacterium]
MGILRSIFLTLGVWTYVIVGIELMLESSAFLGLVLPGDSVVILMGVLSGTSVLSLWVSIALIICCVFVGDVSGYLLGRYKGEAILKKSKRAKREYDRRRERIERYQKRWGMWIVAIGRFLPLIRALTPFTMGIGGMGLPRFVVAAAAASIIWSGGFFVLGYEFGSHWKQLESILKPAAAGVIGIMVLGFGAWYWWRHPQKAKQQFWKAAHWMRCRIAGEKIQ